MADWDPIRMAEVMSTLIGKVGDFSGASADQTPTNVASSQQIDEMKGGALDQFLNPNATSGASGTATADGGHTQPVEGDLRVNSPYGPRGGGFHPGVDLWATQGMSIHAANTGEVIEAVAPASGNYSVISIRGADGVVTRYGHMSGVNVSVGDKVQSGQVIGLSGGQPGTPGAGNAEGPHLHFEVLVDGQTIDPMGWLAQSEQPIVSQAGTPGKALPAGSVTVRLSTPEQVLGGTAQALAGGMASGEGMPQADRSIESQSITAEKRAQQQGGGLSGQTTGADNDPAAVDAFLAATRQHESGGNYASRYQGPVQSDASGAYGFLSSTYHAYGGTTAQAYQASPEEQDAVARRMAMELFNQFHSWRLVAIAWYGGPGVAQQVARGQDPGAPSGQPSYLSYGDYIANAMAGG